MDTMNSDLKAIDLSALTPEQQEAIEKASASIARSAKGKKAVKVKAKTLVHVEGVPAMPPSKPKEAAKPPKGALTRLEVATAKERVFVVNGIKFFAAVGGTGHRILSACDENKKSLESAGRVLTIKGYEVKIKRNKTDKTLWMLDAREKIPSGPWPEEDQPKTESAQ